MQPVTSVIVAATVFVTWRGFQSADLLQRLIFDPRRIARDRELYRIVTSGFLHADWTHLLFNMFSLYSFGSFIEAEFGAVMLLAVYFAAIIGGGLLSLWLHRNEAYFALGASGGVCGVIFAAVFLVPGSSVYIIPLPVAIPAAVFAPLFILISFFGIKTRMGNIGHDAHLGGAIIGLLTATALFPPLVTSSPMLYTAVLGLSTALFLFMSRKR